MKRLRHIGVRCSISLGLMLALLGGPVRSFWSSAGVSYAAWLRVQLQGALSEAVLEEGMQEALAGQPVSLEAFVRAFLQACERRAGGAMIRAALGLPTEASDAVVLAWLLGLVPRLVAEPLLAPVLQAGSGALQAGLQRVASAVFFTGLDLQAQLPRMVRPLVYEVLAFVPETLLFGAVLPMGP